MTSEISGVQVWRSIFLEKETLVLSKIGLAMCNIWQHML